MIKHPDFYEEREWRLASVYGCVNLPINVRIKATRHIPYITLPIQGCINEIMIGPSRRQNCVEPLLQKLLENNSLTEVAIHKSLTPYRG
jgi:hypothetical protein